MKRTPISILLTLFSLLGAVMSHPAGAALHEIITYQGRVQMDGTNLTGSGEFKFALVDEAKDFSEPAIFQAVLDTRDGEITGINILERGAGYAQTEMALTFNDGQGGGSGARATATLERGSVIFVTILNPGSGYTESVRIVAPLPPPNILQNTFWSNDGSSVGGNEPDHGVTLLLDNGLFTVRLGDLSVTNMSEPIPATAFEQPDLRLKTWFRHDNALPYTLLTPDHPMSSVGYAMIAGNLVGGGVGSSQIINNAVTSEKIANGSVQEEDLEVSLTQGTFWRLDGNAGTVADTNFIGTRDDQALAFRVNDIVAFRLEPNILSPNVVGGAGMIMPNVAGATIGGGGSRFSVNVVGGSFGTVSGGSGNEARSPGSTAGGGQANIIHTDADHATISGGNNNQIEDASVQAVISGGLANQILRDSEGAVIGGGRRHLIDQADFGTIGGGATNNVEGDYAIIGGGRDNTNNSASATIGGGAQNLIAFSSPYGTIPGGRFNEVSDQYGFAAGRRAKSRHYGTFVWADPTNEDFASTGDNQFLVRASGGMGINTERPLARLHVEGSAITNRPHLYLLESALNEYARLQLRTTAKHYWEIKTGGPTNAFHVYNARNGTVLTINEDGELFVPVINIMGGADLAEPFPTGAESIPKGALVVIDENRPGHLRMSDQAYDTRVAGVVSGANGVNPGMVLSQKGVLEGDQQIALTGRVYALADAASGAIKPGDLLTTSNTPGHAMKVADHARATGTIVGKAMTPLEEGQGMVLVLVNLH